MIRVLKTSFAVLATMAVVAAALTLSPAASDEAQAASAWDFDAGYIISDANFYDSNSMTAGDVQGFLNARVPNCEAWRDSNPRDVTCLKDYSTQTTAKPADAYCSGYPSQRQTAAQIIDGVARSCGISQKVLLVTLQKENALVNHTWPSSWRYQTAMGYGCPDNAACDTQYYGLFNQIYRAAWQFKYYAAHPNSYAYRAGQNNYVQWNPNAACGGSTVYIRNQATASLYNYTPYQPNNAAKNAGYGSGDHCSSYGNRSFFLWYSDWFGSPTGYPVRGYIKTLWAALGAGQGKLGAPIEQERRLEDGSYVQDFQNGTVSWQVGVSAAYASFGELRAGWGRTGWQNGRLGFPTENERSIPNNAFVQDFSGGTLIWSPTTGANPVLGFIRSSWGKHGWQAGKLGLPTSTEVCSESPQTSCYQLFQGGAVSWTPTTGAHPTLGYLREKWGALAFERGQLGFPTEDERSLTGGAYAQDFQGGTMIWSPSTGAHPVYGAIREAWGGTGWQDGRLGYPSADEVCRWSADHTCTQQFQNGTVTWTESQGTRVTYANR